MRNKIIQEDLAAITAADLPWERLEGKTVLVTGASGFLPAYLVETLLYLNEVRLRRPVQVIGLVRNEQRARDRFSHYQRRPDLGLLVQDVSAPVNAGRKIDVIIHAASQASPKFYRTDPVGTLLPNVIGTYRLLELARQDDAEAFLFFSTGEVYGEVDAASMPVSETGYGYLDPMNLRVCYAESKRMAETMCVAWSHQYQVPVRVVRPFHTYGPGMRLDDGRVFADFVSDIVHRRDITLTSDGSAQRVFCYLADATVGFFTVLFKGTDREAYNIGNDREEISILRLAETLAGLFPERGITVRREIASAGDYMPSPVSRSCPNISKVRALGWEPRTTIRDGFERTIRSFE